MRTTKSRACRLLVAAVAIGLGLTATTASTLAGPVAPPVPVTAWLLDEGTGTDLFEWNGTGTGQLAGPTLPAWSTDTPFSYSGNYSLEYTPTGSANGNYARIDGHTSATKGTLSFWVTDDGGGGPKYITDGAGGARTLLYRAGSTSPLNYYQNNTHIGTMPADLVPTDGTWTHVALVWDNTNPTEKQKVYKNGSLAATFNTSVGAVNPTSVYLGSRQSTNETWDGKIDEYALWNTPLSADEVQWLAGNSVTKIPTALPPTPVKAWLFDEGTGTTANARWGGVDGTLQANVGWTSDTPHGYAGDQALHFDNSDLANAVTFPGHTFGTEGSIQVWAYRLGNAQYLFDASPGGRTLLYAHYELFMNNSYLGAIDGELIPDNEWTHLMITWDNAATDGAREKIYKNGSLFATFDSVLSPRSPATLWLGNRLSNNEPWRGYIDEYALWDTALTPQQIGWLYQNSLQAIPEPATAVLLGLGAVVMLGCGRRRRNRRASV